ncbi:tyrosine-type recombinase/integrase [Flavobacterium sp. NRK F10]|uniref:tyrosine-type recombinase/integrase n=1 Tax=Flavobacterium sp. NRK F10 TaxID=2954931 RepID=UPI002090A727|nr:tyrosine-type recombinase/integrase [Flavobacterium sp. NRK F10]MCO6175384.1 tyrosine-type recombinase/integrase [Flavobacterium sp. NRK F10]
MDFKRYLKEQGLSKTTIEAYHYNTLKFISFLDQTNTEAETCSAKEILLYVSYLQKKGVDAVTKKMQLYSLKHYFSFLIEHKKRKDNPAKKIKLQGTQKPKIYPILTPQELQSLYENYPVPKADDKRSHHNWFTGYRLSKERNKVILGLFVHQGITTAEVSRILVDDLDLRNGKIDIRGGRIGKDRTLELKSNQILDIMEYQYTTRNELLKYQEQNTGQFFLSTPASGKTKVKESGTLSIYKRLTEELKEQNPKFINFLQVRASVITYWLKNYNLRQVQYFAGHKHILSTEMYLINDIDDLQKEIENFHPIG